MLELWKANAISLQIGEPVSSSYRAKRTVLIVGVVVVFIAAFMMFFVMKDYFAKIQDPTKNCAGNRGDISNVLCGFKNGLTATVSVIMVFVFIMVILGVYFVLAQSVPG